MLVGGVVEAGRELDRVRSLHRLIVAVENVLDPDVIVLGGRPLRPGDADLRWIGTLCYRNGQLEETGLAAGVLNHPAASVAWLANKIAANGLALEAGQVVLAGSFIRPIETRKGDTIQADYGPYGTVSCYFA